MAIPSRLPACALLVPFALLFAACSGGASTHGGTDGGSACNAGAMCQPSDPCRTAHTRCVGGVPSCAPDGNAPDGTACGTGKTCQAGSCADASTCHAGDACTQSDPCHAGVTQCDADGHASCVAGDAVADGTDCGGGKQCAGGVCQVPCVPGACDLPGNPCRAGTIDCSQGGACVDSGVAQHEGATCGDSGICSAGNCIQCTPGAACTPSDQPCKQGLQDCSGGAATCVAQAADAFDGTACGDGMTCVAGACIACAQNAACTPPGNPCHAGRTDCSGGSASCVDTGNAADDGTTCGAGLVCHSGSCVSCDAGAECTPTTACRTGVTSCSTGVPMCDVAGNSPDGTVCGNNLVCNNGSCVPCTAGGSCHPNVECALGTWSCSTGTRTCVASGADPAQAGATCGDLTSDTGGTCQGGSCVCGDPTEVYYGNDCVQCPAFNDSTVRVNADPTVGIDDVCCGRVDQKGFGGPCLTIHQALANVHGPGFSVEVRPTASGDVSSREQYPLELHDAVQVSANAGAVPGAPGVFVPGVHGKNVFEAKTDSQQASIVGLTIGTTSKGLAPGALAGVYVGTAPDGSSASVLVYGITVTGTQIGAQADGGTFGDWGGSTFINAKSAGVRCASESTGATTSTVNLGGVNLYGNAQYDVFAGKNCVLTMGQSTVGTTDPAGKCLKTDHYGVWAESNAQVTVSASVIQCMTDDGITLRSDPGQSTNAPQVTVNGNTLTHNGCAGVYAEAGLATVYGNTLTHNHWGAVQSGATSSATAVMTVDGRDPAGNPAANVFKCNGKAEPGSCCTGSSCPPGFDVFNHSGMPLDAQYDQFASSPVSYCKCDQTLLACTCNVGGPAAADGTSVVDAPNPSGTPKTDIHHPGIVADPSCN